MEFHFLPLQPSVLQKLADVSEDGSFDGFEFSLFFDNKDSNQDSKSAEAEEKSTNIKTDNKASMTSKKPTVGKDPQVKNAINVDDFRIHSNLDTCEFKWSQSTDVCGGTEER